MPPRRRLTEGPIGPHLMRLSLPMTVGILSVIAFNFVDTLFVAQLGLEPLAAMSFTFPVAMVVASLAIGLSIGATATLAQTIGQGDEKLARRRATDALVLATLIVGVVSGIGILTIDPLFRALGATDALLPLIRDYMVIWYGAMVFLVVPMVGNGLIRATGDAFYPSAIMVFAALVNTILDPILIFGWFGVPAMGIEGAAIATLIARFATFVAAMAILIFREELITIARPLMSEVMESWRATMRIGLPAAFTNVISPAAFAVVTPIIAAYGTDAVAAFGVASRVEALALVPAFAVASGLTPLIGQNWGAGEVDRVKQAARAAFKVTLIWGVVIYGVLAALAPTIVALFDEAEGVVALGSLYLWIVPLTYGLAGAVSVFTSISNAIGRPGHQVRLNLIRYAVLYLPGAALGAYLFGLIGVIVAFAVAHAGSGLLGLYWTRGLFAERAKAAAE